MASSWSVIKSTRRPRGRHFMFIGLVQGGPKLQPTCAGNDFPPRIETFIDWRNGNLDQDHQALARNER